MILSRLFAKLLHASSHQLGGEDRLQLDANQIDIDGFVVSGAYDELLDGLYLPYDIQDGKTRYLNENGFYWIYKPSTLRWYCTNEASSTEYYYSSVSDDTNYPWDSNPYIVGEDGVGSTQLTITRTHLDSIPNRTVISSRWDMIRDKPTTFPPQIGTGADEAVAGNDPRLSDARTPTTHAASHASGESDAISPESIGAQPTILNTLTIPRQWTGSEQPQINLPSNDGVFALQFPSDGSGTFVFRVGGGTVAFTSEIPTLVSLGAVRAPEIKTSGFTAVAGHTYQCDGTFSVTDPATAALDDTYTCEILSGSITIGGTAYTPSRFMVRRRCSNATGPVWETLPGQVSNGISIASSFALSNSTVSLDATSRTNLLTALGASKTLSDGKPILWDSTAALTRANLGFGAIGSDLATAATLAAARTTLGKRRFTLSTTDTRTNTASATATVGSELTGIPVTSGKSYEVTVLLKTYYTAGSTGGVQFRIAGTPVAFPSLNGFGVVNSFATSTPAGVASSGSAIVILNVSSSPTDSKSQICAKIFFEALASDNIELRWAQNSAVAGATLSLLSGSFIEIEEK